MMGKSVHLRFSDALWEVVHSIHGDSRWFLALAELWNDLTHGIEKFESEDVWFHSK